MRFLIFISVLIVSSSAVIASTIYVPDNFPTIQQAIDAAVDGDSILVKPDLYWEIIDFKGKAITVKSTDGPENTIIFGNFNGSVVTFKNNEGLDSILEGFSLVCGSGTYDSQWGFLGGGIFCKASSYSRPISKWRRFI
jgi:pectin methylesterase-like acyl-CoA thioesterase